MVVERGPLLLPRRCRHRMRHVARERPREPLQAREGRQDRGANRDAMLLDGAALAREAEPVLELEAIAAAEDDRDADHKRPPAAPPDAEAAGGRVAGVARVGGADGHARGLKGWMELEDDGADDCLDGDGGGRLPSGDHPHDVDEALPSVLLE